MRKATLRSFTAIMALCVLLIGCLFPGTVAAADPTPPTSPTNLTVTDRTSSSLNLAWSRSPEIDLVGYEVYQDDVKVAETAATSHAITGLTAGRLYKFRVKAKSATGLLSLADNSVGVLMPAEGAPAVPLPTSTPVTYTASKGVSPGSTGVSGTVTFSTTVGDEVVGPRVIYAVKVATAPERDFWSMPFTAPKGRTFNRNWESSSAPEGLVDVRATISDGLGQFITLSLQVLNDNKPDVVIPPTWKPAPTPPSTRIVGYFASWSRYSGYDIATQLDGSRLTHINYAFAAVQNHRIVIGDPGVDLLNFADLAQLKQRYPHLTLMISVGGWSWSAGFSEAAATDESRAIFAQSAVDFVKTHGFDGVDLDWEYPVTGGGPGTYPNPADKENYPLLLKAVREALDEQGAKDGKHYLLTIAGGATAGFARNASLGLTHQYLDYVQLMSYDIHGTWEPRADFNAPLLDANGETYSVDKGVQAWLDAGVPADKLVMGVPFYGYRYKVDSGANNGLRQTYSNSGSITYKSLINQNLIGRTYQRYWHEGSLVPYLYSPSEQTFITYDDPQSLKAKTDYIRANQLGGVMLWEVTQDYEIDLLDVIYTEMQAAVTDTTAPQTTAAVTGEQGKDGWYISEATVTLSARDNWSGALTTEYSLDGGEWTAYTAPVTIGQGAHTFVYRSSDAAGNLEAPQSLTINVDTTAPRLTVTPDKTELWAPNHKLELVNVTVTAEDGVSVVLTSITANEELEAADIEGAEFGTLDTSFSLRAVRSGKGEGRVYTITYTATDLAGHVTTATATVTVPHDQSKK